MDSSSDVKDKGIESPIENHDNLIVSKESIPYTAPDGLPRLYAHVNREPLEKYYRDFDMSSIWNLPNCYDIVKRIGRGKYSEVFQGLLVDAMDRPTGRIIIKVLKPVRKRKVKREIIILKRLQDGPNIIRLLDTVKDPLSRSAALIFEYLSTIELKEIMMSLSEYETKFYIFQILVALNFCHSKGIIHRDIKPNNLIVDPATHRLRVIDFGLAEFYSPSQPLNVRVASRNYKAPELLIDYTRYDYSLDIWSTGCVFASIIFKKEPFFKGADNLDQLVQICKVMGSKDLISYSNKYSIPLSSQVQHAIGNYPGIELESLGDGQVDPHALNLLKMMLVYDHAQRILPIEAILHPYFSEIREFYSANYNVDWGSPFANLTNLINVAVKRFDIEGKHDIVES